MTDRAFSAYRRLVDPKAGFRKLRAHGHHLELRRAHATGSSSPSTSPTPPRPTRSSAARRQRHVLQARPRARSASATLRAGRLAAGPGQAGVRRLLRDVPQSPCGVTAREAPGLRSGNQGIMEAAAAAKGDLKILAVYGPHQPRPGRPRRSWLRLRRGSPRCCPGPWWRCDVVAASGCPAPGDRQAAAGGHPGIRPAENRPTDIKAR